MTFIATAINMKALKEQLNPVVSAGDNVLFPIRTMQSMAR